MKSLDFSEVLSESRRKKEEEDERLKAEKENVRVSRRYTDYYQGRGQAIRPTATLINIHEHLI